MTSLHTSNPVSRQRWLQTALETLFLLPLALYDVSERRRLSCTHLRHTALSLPPVCLQVAANQKKSG